MGVAGRHALRHCLRRGANCALSRSPEVGPAHAPSAGPELTPKGCNGVNFCSYNHANGVHLCFQTDPDALHGLVELAGATNGLVPAEQLAQDQSIPGRALELIMTELLRAGLVHSQRGPEGRLQPRAARRSNIPGRSGQRHQRPAPGRPH